MSEFALIHWSKQKNTSVVPVEDILGPKEVNSETLVRYGSSKCKGIVKMFHSKCVKKSNA